MSKIDKIKEKISFLKLLFSICVALLISIGSWLINNFNSISFKFIIGCISFILLIILAIKFFIEIYRNIKKLEDL